MIFDLKIAIAKVQRFPEIKTGQELKVVEEPENPVDKNALRFETPEGTRIGYLPAVLACKFSPLLKANKVRFDRVWIEEIDRDDVNEFFYAKMQVTLQTERCSTPEPASDP